ncbi:helix-turn-helix domain-containing protein [Amaricoccus sp.]|uniref:winged helix-turn-helix transcriptional regulator n=1 Tax=Amaricoccus sp. TaxID=1872485 RepID=UPI001B70D6CB|nr:helix-turn-helix domain-containing protein [Amaricoccus sp.]MBP7001802.1 helix-turn-helix transcriptional regulator [Amaricoccus sp.]
MESASYGQFCPVSMAAEILCSRWTILVVRELLCGTTRFNDLRRGVPRMSPSLLSKRLKELEQAGVVRAAPGPSGVVEYRLTPSGEDLRPIVMALGGWGHRWVESQVSLKNLDPSLLMWDMRRWLNPAPLPPGRRTIHFLYPELPESRRNWWLVVDETGDVDLCNADPGFEVDLMVTGPLRSMTAVWMGLAKMQQEVSAGRIALDGDARLARSMQTWLGLSPFAPGDRRVA